jgi:hypothetical protein
MFKIFKKLCNEKRVILEEFIGERMSLAHAEYIKLLVKRAGEVDKTREVFGASKHQYKLNPVASMDDIYRFESKYNIKLPEEYVFFLTMVGNGGAGPYYGLYTLENTIIHNEYSDSISKQAFLNKHLTKEMWKIMMDKLEESDDAQYDEIMEQVYAGLIIIGTQGCTYDNLLMVNGSEEGKIVYIDWNLEPEYGPHFTYMTLLEWYESYFREIIFGNSVGAYGYIRLGKEEELISDYQNTLIENKRDILKSFLRFSSVKEETVEFLKCRDDKFLDDLRVELLFKFNRKAGMEMFDSLIKGENLEVAILCARRMPDELKDNYYSDMVKLLYNKGLKEQERIIFFLTDCKSLLGKDLISFAMDDTVEGKNRKIAIWAISKAVDKVDYLDQFISWMLCDSYWIAHTALQGMAEEKDQKLLETYK